MLLDLIQTMIKEGSEESFEYRGYKCQALRMGRLHHINGYVELPVGHKYHGMNYDNIPVDVHGGLTYSRLDGNGSWKIGFDTAHYGDLSLHNLILFRDDSFFAEESTYRTMKYVVEEIKKLVDQLD